MQVKPRPAVEFLDRPMRHRIEGDEREPLAAGFGFERPHERCAEFHPAVVAVDEEFRHITAMRLVRRPGFLHQHAAGNLALIFGDEDERLTGGDRGSKALPEGRGILHGKRHHEAHPGTGRDRVLQYRGKPVDAPAIFIRPEHADRHVSPSGFRPRSDVNRSRAGRRSAPRSPVRVRRSAWGSGPPAP